MDRFWQFVSAIKELIPPEERPQGSQSKMLSVGGLLKERIAIPFDISLFIDAGKFPCLLVRVARLGVPQIITPLSV